MGCLICVCVSSFSMLIFSSIIQRTQKQQKQWTTFSTPPDFKFVSIAGILIGTRNDPPVSIKTSCKFQYHLTNPLDTVRSQKVQVQKGQSQSSVTF